MKRIDLERYLRERGCLLYREGSGHSIWSNPSQRKITSVPRHREIKEGQFAQFTSSLKFLSPDTSAGDNSQVFSLILFSRLQEFFLHHPPIAQI